MTIDMIRLVIPLAGVIAGVFLLIVLRRRR
jgi:hypothetical protein